MSRLPRLDGTPFRVRPDGTLLLNVMLTFHPGRDDALIARIQHAPKRGIAGIIVQMMHEGALAERASEDADDDLDLSGLAQDL